MMTSFGRLGFFSALVVLGLAAASGCSSDKTGTTSASDTITGVCGTKLSAKCPTTTPPTYTKDIIPIFDAKCTMCHRPGAPVPDGGPLPPWPLNDYDHVVTWRDALLKDMIDCSMPPQDASETLDTADRALIETWLICGSPK